MMWSSCFLVILKGLEILWIVSTFPSVEDAFTDSEVTTGLLCIPFMGAIPINPPQTFQGIRRKTRCSDLLYGENFVCSHIRAIVSAGHRLIQPFSIYRNLDTG